MARSLLSGAESPGNQPSLIRFQQGWGVRNIWVTDSLVWMLLMAAASRGAT